MRDVEGYLESVNTLQRNELVRVRNIIRDAVPDAEEVISYGMPGFRYKGRYLIAYAAFKNHLSIFPGAEAVESYKKQLAGYKLSKGTIQFTADNPLADKIIVGIIKLGIKRIDSEVK